LVTFSCTARANTQFNVYSIGINNSTSTHLDESNILGSLTEALSAHINVVLSDDGLLIGANSASAGTLRSMGVLGVAVNKAVGSIFNSACVNKH
jgi:hypothetical protein